MGNLVCLVGQVLQAVKKKEVEKNQARKAQLRSIHTRFGRWLQFQCEHLEGVLLLERWLELETELENKCRKFRLPR